MTQTESGENKRATGSTRRLTAIMFTDMVGYSALVQKDEPLAMELLDMHRKLVRKLIPGFGGREVETAGDSFLIEFGSALDAMNCAIAMQQRHGGNNASASSERHITIRIGLHVGDIEHRRGGKVFGDGVNLAARIEPLAPHGGISVSSQLHAQVKHRVTASFRSLGRQALKNITEPMEVFALDSGAIAALPAPEPRARLMPVRLDWRWVAAIAGVLATVAMLAGLLRMTPATAPDKSVAVLPFANMSEDKANAYFADGVQDEILTALSRIKALKVISRTSTEQYRGKPHDLPSIAQALGVATVLEGGVQRAGNRVRINVQLIDARNDAHLWAESYDRDVTDLFAVQSEVARQVAQALQASLLPAEAKALAAAPTQNTRAYGLYLQAANRARRILDENIQGPPLMQPAIALYEQALALDPDFALAAAGLARAHMWMYWAHDQTPAHLAAAKNTAEHALALQPNLGEAHFALGLYHYWGHRDYDAALEQFELARRALPNNADVAGIIAAIARRQGRWYAALEGLKQASVLDPQSSDGWYQLGWTYTVLGRYPEAEVALDRAVAVSGTAALTKVVRGRLTLLKGDLGPLRAALGALTPGSADYLVSLFDSYYLHQRSRDYDAALKALADSPHDWPAHYGYPVPKPLLAAKAWQAKGDSARARLSYAEAQALLEAALKERPEDPDLHANLGLAHAGLGRREAAVAAGKRAVALLPVSKDAVTGPIYLALLAEIYVATGDYEHAIELLRQLLAMPAGLMMSPALLKLDPAWDPLRQDPRFQKLIAAHLPKT
jgi:TolB-like protein/class 3 adenylate cyclase/Tfp pilus assembly protein PilF